MQCEYGHTHAPTCVSDVSQCSSTQILVRVSVTDNSINFTPGRLPVLLRTKLHTTLIKGQAGISECGRYIVDDVAAVVIKQLVLYQGPAAVRIVMVQSEPNR